MTVTVEAPQDVPDRPITFDSDLVDDLTAIPDARDRAERSAEVANRLSRELEAHRLHRNFAMLTLIRNPDYGWNKTRVARHTGVTRTTFKNVVDLEPAEFDFVTDPDVVARTEQVEIERLYDLYVDILAVRDETILTLLFEETPPMPNYKVAELTGMNQVRIAQLRRDAAL